MKEQELTLVVMAAGMGSRFGGLKQIEPLGPNGEFIIDYSVYDAKRAGFTKVVFIIKKELEKIFKETIGKRIEGKIEVEYVIQDIKTLPIDIDLTKREKPLGTAHAIYCCKNIVKTPFAIINADDFYGYDAYQKIADFLKTSNENEYGLVGYIVKNTMTENGSVKRGICKAKDGYLTNIIESKIEKINNKIIATPLEGGNQFEVEEDRLVSMNMLGFKANFMPYLEKYMKDFLTNKNNDLYKDEALIPSVLEQAIQEKYAKVKVLKTTSTWYGVTYKEDKEYVINGIQKLIDMNEYPNKLWEN